MKHTRTSSGTFRAKRFDTMVSTIEKKYGVDLGVRDDKKLGNYLREKGYTSLSEMLKEVQK